jgi:hypothetical protein
MRPAVLPFVFLFGALCFGQIDGESAYADFLQWRKIPENASLKWEAATEKYAAKLTASGVSDVAKLLRIIEARDEGTL